MKTVIVLVAYNPYSIFKECISALRAYLSKESQLVIVDGHSPDKETRAFLQKIDWALIIDPGKNLGCINNFNFGFEWVISNVPDCKVMAKLDDDTFLLTKDGDIHLSEYVLNNPDVAYCASKIPVAPKVHSLVEFKGHSYGLSDETNFSFLFFTKSRYLEFGRMGPIRESERLYGMGEAMWRSKAKKNNLKEITCSTIHSYHHGEADRILYSLWKTAYGLFRVIDCDYEDFVNSKELMLKAYRERITKCTESTKQGLENYFRKNELL